MQGAKQRMVMQMINPIPNKEPFSGILFSLFFHLQAVILETYRH